MIDRRDLLIGAGLGAISAAFPLLAQPVKPARLGILSARSRSTPARPDYLFDAFLQALRKLGYVDGKNLSIEWRFADGNYDRLPALASELAQSGVDVVITHNTPGTRAMQQASKTLPIVMTSVVDPVGSGFAASLARPGGNITGVTLITIDFIPKHLELLVLLMPGLSRIAVLMHRGNVTHPRMLKGIEAVAKPKGILLVPQYLSSSEEIDSVFAAMARDKLLAAIALTESFVTLQRHRIAEAALKHRVAVIYSDREHVRSGLLISYGTDSTENYRRAATYVDKILKGATPGEIPIEQPAKFHLAINRKTASALGIKIPQELIGRADEMID